MKIRSIYVYLCFMSLISFDCANLRGKSSFQPETLNKGKNEEGILVINALSAFENHDAVKVFNADGSLFTVIKRLNDQEPSSDKLSQEKILAYYSDYYIIHFEGEKLSDSLYSVGIGKDSKLITRSRYTEFLSWADYMMRYYLTTDKSNPLRQTPSSTGKIIEGIDYSNLSFVGIEISGDWIKVKCDKECEGCGDGPIVSGWVRWRMEGKVIVKQFYIC